MASLPGIPSFLFLWTHPQAANAICALGNTRLATPNLDRLSAASVAFRRAYRTQPICTP